MFTTWRLLHTFGFVFWFAGLLGSTAATVAVRRAKDAAARSGAFAVMERLRYQEILGMVLTPIAGFATGVMLAGGVGEMFRNPALRFVHIKLVLVVIAIVCNALALAARRRARAHLGTDDAAFGAAMKRVSMFQGIATLMLAAAVVVVIAMKYSGA